MLESRNDRIEKAFTDSERVELEIGDMNIRSIDRFLTLTVTFGDRVMETKLPVTYRSEEIGDG